MTPAAAHARPGRAHGGRVAERSSGSSIPRTSGPAPEPRAAGVPGEWYPRPDLRPGLSRDRGLLHAGRREAHARRRSHHGREEPEMHPKLLTTAVVVALAAMMALPSA